MLVIEVLFMAHVSVSQALLPRVFMLLMCAFLVACDAVEPIAINDIIAQHTTARGGQSKLEGVNNVDVELNIVEPKFTLNGRYRATRDGYMRIDVYAGEQRVFTEVLGPDGGWQMFDDGKVASLSDEGTKALVRGIVGNLYAVHERAELGYAYRLIGLVDHGDASFYQVQEVAPDGFSRQLFFDTESFLILRDIETSALHPDIDATEQRQETRHTDFAQIDGIVFSNLSENYDLDSGERIQQTTVTKRTINVNIDPSIFLRPKL